MLDPITSSVLVLLGKQAFDDIIKPAVADHAKDLVKRLFEKGEASVFGKKEEDALEAAYRDALTQAYSRAVEALGNVLKLMVSDDEIKRYRDSVKRFLKSKRVAEHLLETVRDLSNESLPDPQFLEQEWDALWGEPLPLPGAWQLVAANFRKGAQEKAFITPDMRAVLNARNIDQIRQLGERLLGVQITVKHEQYVSVMRKTYAPVDLARIAPATAEDPGTLIVTDIFEPQDVRENPQPVAITKDELEQLVRAGKLEGRDEQEVIAILEDGGQDVTQRLKFQRASYAEQPVRPVLDVVRSMAAKTGIKPENHLVVMTGEPGSGKSTLLRYLLLGILEPLSESDYSTRTLAWAENFKSSSIAGSRGYFPFLIELRDYHFTCEQEQDVNSLMDYARFLGETMGYGIDDQWLDQRLKSGSSLVMFDGLDEIFDPKRRDDVMKQIVGFTETYPLARVIVTSRPHGYHEGILRPAGFAHYRLQDLDRQQKENFTRAWFSRVFPNDLKNSSQRIERVLNSVDRSPSVRWLAGIPLLLTIMCLIARERELPEERAEFYEQCLDVLVHQWEVNNHLQMEELAFLTVYRKRDLLRKIAFEMQASQAGLRGNFIAEEELLQIIRRWFEENYDDLKGTKSDIASQQMIEGLWKRNYVLCPRGPKLYGFLHRTFMEFLTATEYVYQFEKTEDFSLEDLNEVFRQHGNDPEWSEVLRLICSDIGDEFAEHLIRTLFELKEFSTAALSANTQPNHLLLGIYCMSELRGLSKMQGLGRLAMEKCIEFIRDLAHYWPLNSFCEEFLASISEIGTRWPNVEGVLSNGVRGIKFKYAGHQLYPELEAAVLRDRVRAEELVNFQEDLGGGWVDGMRNRSLIALNRWWPDERTRHILEIQSNKQINEGESSFSVRAKALELLANNKIWADESTYQLLRRSALNDSDDYTRGMALELLTRNVCWVHRDTRDFLQQRVFDDQAAYPRTVALRLLTKNDAWSDDLTHQILHQRAIEDPDAPPRSTALELLAGNEVWANEATRQLLHQRAIEDPDAQPRSTALALLAGNEVWANEEIRQLLHQRAIEDPDAQPRSTALRLLVVNQVWANEEIRQLLVNRAIEDPDAQPRSTALELLAGNEVWANEEIRQLLVNRALHDEDYQPREQSLKLLMNHEKWKKYEDTLALLRVCKDWIRTAMTSEIRGWAACFYFSNIDSSDSPTNIKSWIFSRDADGLAPFLDPLEPISDEHLEKITQRSLDLSDAKLNQVVEQVSISLGWDIRKGRNQPRTPKHDST